MVSVNLGWFYPGGYAFAYWYSNTFPIWWPTHAKHPHFLGIRFATIGDIHSKKCIIPIHHAVLIPFIEWYVIDERNERKSNRALGYTRCDVTGHFSLTITTEFLSKSHLVTHSRLSDNKSSSVCVFFTTNFCLIFKGVVSSRINWFAFSFSPCKCGVSATVRECDS